MMITIIQENFFQIVPILITVGATVYLSGKYQRYCAINGIKTEISRNAQSCHALIHEYQKLISEYSEHSNYSNQNADLLYRVYTITPKNSVFAYFCQTGYYLKLSEENQDLLDGLYGLTEVIISVVSDDTLLLNLYFDDTNLNLMRVQNAEHIIETCNEYLSIFDSEETQKFIDNKRRYWIISQK